MISASAVWSELCVVENCHGFYELLDLIDDPWQLSACFQNFDVSIREEPSKKRTWLSREGEFERLDAETWENLKGEALPYLTARDAKGRGWEQLISILNQTRAHNYLTEIGCSQVRFISRAKRRGQGTPDLEGDLNGQRVLCEVKTINQSQSEVDKRQAGRAGSTTNILDVAFFRKLDSDITNAKRQMDAYGGREKVKRIAFIVINFDEWPGQYKSDYFAQIDEHLRSDQNRGIDIVFYNQRTAFHAHVSVAHADVVNEPG
jgi:hypothetical protein